MTTVRRFEVPPSLVANSSAAAAVVAAVSALILVSAMKPYADASWINGEFDMPTAADNALPDYEVVS